MPEEPMHPDSGHLRRKRFIRRNIIIYLIPNMLFNTLLPYAIFTQQGSVQLFDGKENLARFLLPMSLLLPFILTFDILKKVMEAAEKQKFDLEVAEAFPKKRFMWQLALRHATATFVCIGIFVGTLHFSTPNGQQYDILISSVLMGVLAGAYSLLFPVLAVRKLEREVSSSANPLDT